MQINSNLTTINFTDTNNTGRIKYIVVHYTANNGDTAKGNTNYFKSTYRGASAHYFVDETSIWQSVKDEDVAWHCGTSGAYKHALCRNNNSIGIEMCSRKDSKGIYYIKEDVLTSTTSLTKYLMKKYNIPLENVVRHFDVTGKICPEPFVRNSSQWVSFKKELTYTNNDAVSEQSEYKASETSLKAMVDYGVINSPEYWRNAKLKYLDHLFANATKDGMLHENINNGVSDFDMALNILTDAGIINSPDYLKNAAESGEIEYLKSLIINMANKSRIVLEKIVHAEACGEEEKGQILVANVINNRVKSKSYPNGIYDVVFQKDQFEPTRNGAYEKAVPSTKVKIAVSKSLCGEDYSKGALFFRTIKGVTANSWHERALTRLFDFGGHRFYQ